MRRTLMPIASYGNAISKYQADKPYLGDENEARPNGNTGRRSKAAAAKRKKVFAAIVKLIRESPEPVTTHEAAEAVGVKRKRICDYITEYADCPFCFGETVALGQNGYQPRRLVVKEGRGV